MILRDTLQKAIKPVYEALPKTGSAQTAIRELI